MTIWIDAQLSPDLSPGITEHGTEDYRHAVSGSQALACFYWLSGATLAASLQWGAIAAAATAATQRRTARHLAYALIALLLLVLVAGAYSLKTRSASLEAVVAETPPTAVGAPRRVSP